MVVKTLLDIARLIVGGLFIFSGLIKVNDPVGTSIKLEEYFDVFSTDIAPFFEYLKAVSLPLAVILVILEVALGVMVITRWKFKIGIYLLMVMILFFTFLTFYSAYFNKVTDCGCFGDAIKLTPWESFYKDIFLLLLILFLFIFQKRVGENRGTMVMVLSVGSLAISLMLAVYAIRNLPFIDFRAYKEGVHIHSAMLPSEQLEYTYLMRKDGEVVSFDDYPDDETYEFEEMVLKNPDALPKISDFSVWNENGDFSELILSGKKILILTPNISKIDMPIQAMDGISALINEFRDTDNVEVLMVGASSEAQMQEFLDGHDWKIPYYLADATVVKTIIRSNPGLVFLSDGLILNKFHFRNTPEPSEARRILKE